LRLFGGIWNAGAIMRPPPASRPGSSAHAAFARGEWSCRRQEDIDERFMLEGEQLGCDAAACRFSGATLVWPGNSGVRSGGYATVYTGHRNTYGAYRIRHPGRAVQFFRVRSWPVSKLSKPAAHADRLTLLANCPFHRWPTAVASVPYAAVPGGFAATGCVRTFRDSAIRARIQASTSEAIQTLARFPILIGRGKVGSV
jgi:hypothetical protein